MRDVVISGMGVVSSLGHSTTEIFENLLAGASNIRFMSEWEKITGLRTKLAAPAQKYETKHIPRGHRRTMSAMSAMALLAARDALSMAGISDLNKYKALICGGSTSGSPETLESNYRMFFERGGHQGMLSTTFFKVMNHSVAANLCVGLEFDGPQLGISSACSTASQALIVGWELIQTGLYDLVVTVGADELNHTTAAIFDNVAAASIAFNDRPQMSPRPFDRDRDGLVVSEGASVIVIEALDHARARKVRPLAKICGGAYHCSSAHMSQPQTEGMKLTMEKALERSGISKDKIQYINAHGTATRLGDARECAATAACFGDQVPVSSLKGHMGHSLAACGGIEIAATVEMMRRNVLIPTRMLENIDIECRGVRHLQTLEELPQFKYAISNNFAFGGMNTSVVIEALED